jgi:hypothetical protein
MMLDKKVQTLSVIAWLLLLKLLNEQMEAILLKSSSTEMELVKDKLKEFAKLKSFKLNKH